MPYPEMGAAYEQAMDEWYQTYQAETWSVFNGEKIGWVEPEE